MIDTTEGHPVIHVPLGILAHAPQGTPVHIAVGLDLAVLVTIHHLQGGDTTRDQCHPRFESTIGVGRTPVLLPMMMVPGGAPTRMKGGNILHLTENDLDLLVSRGHSRAHWRI